MLRVGAQAGADYHAWISPITEVIELSEPAWEAAIERPHRRRKSLLLPLPETKWQFREMALLDGTDNVHMKEVKYSIDGHLVNCRYGYSSVLNVLVVWIPRKSDTGTPIR